MKRTGYLWDDITTFENLSLAAYKALRGKKAQPHMAEFFFHLEPQLIQLQDELRGGYYVPGAYRCFDIYEPKPRRICAADFRDRVVHHAVCNILEPLFDRRMIYDSYACRTGKGAHAAVKRAQQFSRRWRYVLQFDVKKFFASVDHAVLKRLLHKIIKDPSVLAILTQIIDHPTGEHAVSKGLPIGNLTSQHFANLYLNELDHLCKDTLRIKGYVRYMDDCLVFAPNKKTLWQYLAVIEGFLQQHLHLQLKPSATRVVPVSEGIAFLGFRLFPHIVRLNQRTLRRFRRGLKNKEQAFLQGKITTEQWVHSVSAMLAHIRHANSLRLRQGLLSRSLLAG